MVMASGWLPQQKDQKKTNINRPHLHTPSRGPFQSSKYEGFSLKH